MEGSGSAERVVFWRKNDQGEAIDSGTLHGSWLGREKVFCNHSIHKRRSKVSPGRLGGVDGRPISVEN